MKNETDARPQPLFFGVDLGGTTVNIGRVETDGSATFLRQIPSLVHKGASDVASRIAEAIGEMAGPAAIQGVGIGVAGLVDAERGVLQEAANFPQWHQVPLAELLAERLHAAVYLENDANAAALGEYNFGAGRGCRFMLMVTLGTGVGGGLVLDGKIYRGGHGVAGEFGHMTIDLNGELCGCGRRGCVEAYVGSKALIRSALELRRSRPESPLHGYDAETLTPKIICELARKGDEASRLVFARAGEKLGAALGNVANLLDIERVVIGGGVAGAGDLLFEAAEKKLRETALNLANSQVVLLPSQLGNAAGVIGAASLAMAADSNA